MILHELEHQYDLRTWLSHKINYQMPDNSFCIGHLRNGDLVGVVGFCHHINKSIMIHSAGTDEYWVSRELLKEVFAFPFLDLGCSVLIGQVGSNNHAALKFNQHLGFKISCIIEDAHQDGDLVIMTMYKNECRYIKQAQENNVVQLENTA